MWWAKTRQSQPRLRLEKPRRQRRTTTLRYVGDNKYPRDHATLSSALSTISRIEAFEPADLDTPSGLRYKRHPGTIRLSHTGLLAGARSLYFRTPRSCLYWYVRFVCCRGTSPRCVPSPARLWPRTLRDEKTALYNLILDTSLGCL